MLAVLVNVELPLVAKSFIAVVDGVDEESDEELICVVEVEGLLVEEEVEEDVLGFVDDNIFAV